MSSQPHDRLHPVVDCAHQLRDRLDSVSGVPVWSMRPDEHEDTLTTLAQVQAQVDALQLRVLAEADRSGAVLATGASTAADWLAAETRQVPRDARADLRLAESLERHDLLSSAFAEGRVNTAQVRAIVGALDRLPTTGKFAVGPEQRAEAETHLVSLADDHDAKALRVLGGRILEVIAPDLADAFDGKALEAEEAKAARRTTLTMWEDDEGTCHGRFRIPARHGQMLRKAILSLTNPVRPETTTHSPIDTDLPAPVRAGVALTEVIEAIDASWLPSAGGVGATVVVTMTLEQLLDDADASSTCSLDTGGRITAGEARRLACRAGIVPVVLGGPSVVLDVGTRRRFHTQPMRLAMGLRDGGCVADGCDVPPSMCHAHHDLPYSEGGATSVANGRLLCGHHHRRIHDPAFEHRRLPNGKVAFHRRT